MHLDTFLFQLRTQITTIRNDPTFFFTEGADSENPLEVTADRARAELSPPEIASRIKITLQKSFVFYVEKNNLLASEAAIANYLADLKLRVKSKNEAKKLDPITTNINRIFENLRQTHPKSFRGKMAQDLHAILVKEHPSREEIELLYKSTWVIFSRRQYRSLLIVRHLLLTELEEELRRANGSVVYSEEKGRVVGKVPCSEVEANDLEKKFGKDFSVDGFLKEIAQDKQKLQDLLTIVRGATTLFEIESSNMLLHLITVDNILNKLSLNEETIDDTFGSGDFRFFQDVFTRYMGDPLLFHSKGEMNPISLTPFGQKEVFPGWDETICSYQDYFVKANTTGYHNELYRHLLLCIEKAKERDPSLRDVIGTPPSLEEYENLINYKQIKRNQDENDLWKNRDRLFPEKAHPSVKTSTPARPPPRKKKAAKDQQKQSLRSESIEETRPAPPDQSSPAETNIAVVPPERKTVELALSPHQPSSSPSDPLPYRIHSRVAGWRKDPDGSLAAYLARTPSITPQDISFSHRVAEVLDRIVWDFGYHYLYSSPFSEQPAIALYVHIEKAGFGKGGKRGLLAQTFNVYLKHQKFNPTNLSLYHRSLSFAAPKDPKLDAYCRDAESSIGQSSLSKKTVDKLRSLVGLKGSDGSSIVSFDETRGTLQIRDPQWDVPGRECTITVPIIEHGKDDWPV